MIKINNLIFFSTCLQFEIFFFLFFTNAIFLFEFKPGLHMEYAIHTKQKKKKIESNIQNTQPEESV